MLFLSVLMLLVSANSLCAADDELYAAMFTDNLLFEAYNSHGMPENIETLAKMADMKTLERVAGSASKVKDTAEVALKIVKAYQEGKRGAELAEIVAKEVGKIGYKKIKNIAAEYIKSKVSVLGQLESAYQIFGALHDTSSYIAYVGMSIGLDMMSEETIKRLEKSGFHKAAVWITNNIDTILSMSAKGKEEAIKQFLIATEGTAFERFSYAVINGLKKTLRDANTAALDIGQGIIDYGTSFIDWIKTSWTDSEDNVTPAGDSVANNDDNNSSIKSGDLVVTVNDSSSNNLTSTPSGDNVFADSENTPIAWEHNSDDATPAIGNVLVEIKDNSPVVGPNIPHYRILWLFSGENWGDVAGSVVENAIDLFKSGNFSDIGKTISEEMGFEEMKTALQSIGD